MLRCLLLSAVLAQNPTKVPQPVEAALASSIRVFNDAHRTEGSGIVLGRVGPLSYALTAAHVVDGTKKLSIFPLTGARDQQPLVATVKETTPMAGADLALILIEDPAGRLVKMGIDIAKNPPATSFQAYSIGIPGAGKQLIRSEPVLEARDVKKQNGTAKFWKCKNVPLIGRSGGPLVDRDGTLLGILSGGDESYSYFAHVAEIRALIDRSGVAYVRP